MCGIVGVLGQHEVAPMLVEALRRMEYRGYDSAGIATLQDSRLDRRRAAGKLVELSDLLVHDPLPGKIGIGHTRWATHGAPTVGNAHPHRAGPVAVVHNGIIENFRDLRAELAAVGLTSSTDTDTETVALLAQHHMAQGLDPVAAARRTVDRLDGAFALCFLFDGHPDLIVAARRGSPLAIGHGEGEMFVGSDAIALAPLTNRLTYLEEGDFAVLTRDGVEITDTAGTPVAREMRTLAPDTSFVDKGGHKYFMAKEIGEQPLAIGDTLAEYLREGTPGVTLPEGLDFSAVSRITMVACGTAYYACLTAKYWFEQLARLPVEVDIASEFRYREPPMPEGSLAVFVSQSGETADTLAALRHVAGQGVKVASVVNVPESSIARESDVVLPTRAGVEIGVASTKAFTCQLTVLAAMAVRAAADRGTLTEDRMAQVMAALRAVPGAVNQALSLASDIAGIAAELAEAQDVLFLGRGALFPMALEGALKLKEISYIHAEGYASGELKHGPIALIDPNVPVVVLAPMDRLFDKTVSNMQEVMARGGKVLLVSDGPGLERASDGVWKWLRMPQVDPVFAPIAYAVPVQLLAYHTAVAKGTDVDQPRNLAKSVTVE
ncbi:glutamine--fructose-6-phosphate transaminase (isomerizing) [Meridianimarinicoccus roseus]|jgi:glucosamine--fructose-6-phosphate aminotransferase (isomerizing)|uniref:Glutamine--fructose-6-phosphate aminotransferase [isomerizing] n=1 Tax=Meridianimarinicoccus roseus TaxID=2072018 RepID=A0A2V2LSC1_9RHOB|nr:glutamine--fructose-6-phosphate transaminase (isomerizing) [Meridianimarinicoccus roseus]PWR02142.1 glutamine--fructose-6-phosphate transaminase (isomerizing) [Meridianimarinicoccus roseus]PWR03833.1 glutamine--fructose-6-phosphate transaminase (isomerizing) [Meridianimarinicoccus roseus]PWR03982.1 glutamine--fructose-6-phosphate transaminase (isomerizing) [Meridianimarinicoccus roseus]PWR04343.1 glutamine--fructose-6-phosphate transaminase (isomerizing) [Meridianimarinicoccus roseus]